MSSWNTGNTIEEATPLTSILLVDRAEARRLVTKWFLELCGYQVDCCMYHEDALNTFRPGIHRAVVASEWTDELDRPGFAEIIKRQSPETRVLLCSGAGMEEPPPGVDASLQRPFHVLALKETIDTLLGVQNVSPEPAVKPLSST